MDGSEMNHGEFLATQLPEFAAERLAEVFSANDCDLNLTTEKLTQHVVRGRGEHEGKRDRRGWGKKYF